MGRHSTRAEIFGDHQREVALCATPDVTFLFGQSINMVLKASEPGYIDLDRLLLQVSTNLIAPGIDRNDLNYATQVEEIVFRDAVFLQRGVVGPGSVSLRAPGSVFSPYRKQSPIRLGMVYLPSENEIEVTLTGVMLDSAGNPVNAQAFLAVPFVPDRIRGEGMNKAQRRLGGAGWPSAGPNQWLSIADTLGGGLVQLSLEFPDEGAVDIGSTVCQLNADWAAGMTDTDAVPRAYFSSIKVPGGGEELLLGSPLPGRGIGLPATAFGSVENRFYQWFRFGQWPGNQSQNVGYELVSPVGPVALGTQYVPTDWAGPDPKNSACR